MSSTMPIAAPYTIGGANNGVSIDITAAGDIHAIRHGADFLISQYRPGLHDAMLSGVFLRRHLPGSDAVEHEVLVGSRSESTLSIGADSITWHREALDIECAVALIVDRETDMWVWRVDLTPGSSAIPDAEYEIVVAQDLSLSPAEVAMSAEPYVCQYIVHRELTHPTLGSVLASRQTMTMAPKLPVLLSSILEGTAAFLTDGFQTYGLEAKLDGVAHALEEAAWQSRNYQYEFTLPTLLSNRFALPQAKRLHAMFSFAPDERGDLVELADRLDAVAERAAALGSPEYPEEPFAPIRSRHASAVVLAGRDVSDEELQAIAGDPRFPEIGEDGRLLSYFTTDGSHVVRGRKELIVERSHGHVLRAGGAVAPTDNILSATSYACGVFASHIVLGNTSFNRVVTVHRQVLNLLRSSGVRVLIETDEGLRILGMPSILTIDLGGVHWVYLTELGRIDVYTVASADSNVVEVQLRTERPFDIMMTVELEDQATWKVEQRGENLVSVRPTQESYAGQHYPDLSYVFGSSAPITDDSALLSQASGSLLLASATASQRLDLTIAADLTESAQAETLAQDHMANSLNYRGECDAQLSTVSQLARGIRFDDERDELNILVPWYVHNALVHFLVPHGLEQYSGAAWGTRDLCQGPFELHMAMGRFDVVREIVLRAFRHQYAEGDFPQWFMFDAYSANFQDHAHGDVVVWPLFALAQYLDATQDDSILDVEVPFWDVEQRRPGTEAVQIRDHLVRLVDFLDTHMVPGTSLPSYRDGDWDDTLQPAEPEMRTKMASAWTTALLFQASKLAARTLRGSKDAALARRLDSQTEALAEDFSSLLIKDDVLAGYVTRIDGETRHIIHPSDTRSGISYRLIPMTRAMISEMFDPGQVDTHEGIIESRLHFVDGVRLMDRPASFDDGVTHLFLRAEQAANFGREIGLMYTHAHIRYVEALARLGRARAFDELMRISPVGLGSRLENALPRQRNTYFSSSDGVFDDRYLAAEGFDGLRAGSVATKGGWRVYSSGPGIFLRQLMHGVLGLIEHESSVIFDPTIDSSHERMTVSLSLAGVEREITYRVGSGDSVQVFAGESPSGLTSLSGSTVANRYRHGGLEIDKNALGTSGFIEIHVPAGT